MLIGSVEENSRGIQWSEDCFKEVSLLKYPENEGYIVLQYTKTRHDLSILGGISNVTLDWLCRMLSCRCKSASSGHVTWAG